MEKYDFIKLMLKSRNLSVNEKKRLVLLATREIEKGEFSTNENIALESKGDDVTLNRQEILHLPKDTASFLALFNNPQGLKFLTHDFDPDSDMDYDQLIKHARSVFKESTQKYHIPKSLYALMYTILYGGKKDGKNRTWMDSHGDIHNENYATESWAKWAHENPKMHLLSNNKIAEIILNFRSSIRLVKPVLNDIVKRQETKHSNLTIQTEGLGKADFYTYVWNLENGIRRILDDMSRYATKTPNIKITFERKYSDDFSSRVIKITQIGSVSSSLEDVIARFKGTGGAGAFNEIQKVFAGYCNWSVEALWDGLPKRWNILSDTDVPEVEDISDTTILGFTHVLTYFSK